MKRIGLLAFLLAACSCATEPIAPNAQAQIDAIKTRYSVALAAHSGICSPICYTASSAIVTADSQRTQNAITAASLATRNMEQEP